MPGSRRSNAASSSSPPSPRWQHVAQEARTRVSWSLVAVLSQEANTTRRVRTWCVWFTDRSFPAIRGPSTVQIARFSTTPTVRPLRASKCSPIRKSVGLPMSHLSISPVVPMPQHPSRTSPSYRVLLPVGWPDDRHRERRRDPRRPGNAEGDGRFECEWCHCW